MPDEYVSVEALIDFVDDNLKHIGIGEGYMLMEQFIEYHERIEVVQCKDCVKWHEETGWCDEHSYFVDSTGMACSPEESPDWKMFQPDYFCKDGERSNCGSF